MWSVLLRSLRWKRIRRSRLIGFALVTAVCCVTLFGTYDFKLITGISQQQIDYLKTSLSKYELRLPERILGSNLAKKGGIILAKINGFVNDNRSDSSFSFTINPPAGVTFETLRMADDYPITDNINVSNMKIIYAATETPKDFPAFDFSRCSKYRNCIGKAWEPNVPLSEVKFDVGVFRFAQLRKTGYSKLNNVPWESRQHQKWLLAFVESWGFSYNSWPASVDNLFNGTMTFRRDSEVHWDYGKTMRKAQSTDLFTSRGNNLGVNKTKGAFAYVSHCNSMGYNRLALMKELKQYIDVDIFGRCTGQTPCEIRDDMDCDREKHGMYRFYLSFENSLCMDYITEKFWNRLASKNLYVPVAVGGANMSDYARLAPPDSFIHINNFTSVEALGKYLQYLINDTSAYNKYHAWRDNYEVNPEFVDIMPCRLCEFANMKQEFPVIKNLSAWWIKGPKGFVPP